MEVLHVLEDEQNWERNAQKEISKLKEKNNGNNKKDNVEMKTIAPKDKDHWFFF